MALRVETVVLRGPRDVAGLMAASRQMRATTVARQPSIGLDASIEALAPGTHAVTRSADPGEIGGMLQDTTVETLHLDAAEAARLSREADVLDVLPNLSFSSVREAMHTPDRGDTGGAAVRPDRVSWGIQRIGADEGSADWGKGARVAVLDSGIDAGHPAFAGLGANLVQTNFVSGSPDGDQDGHGTHCAGTLVGGDVDGIRIGVARGVDSLLAAKVLHAGRGTMESISAGLFDALGFRADIILLSIEMDFIGYRNRLEDEFHYPPAAAMAKALDGYRENVRFFDEISQMLADFAPALNAPLLIAASGNLSARPDYTITATPPAIGRRFLSVGATGSRDEVADFSNAHPKLVAPGIDIWSASPGGGIVADSGTSMAAPHVAGIAAVIVGQLRAAGQRNIDGQGIQDRILAACRALEEKPEDAGRGLAQVVTNP